MEIDMYLGRMVEIGPTPEAIGSPAHPYTRAWLSAIPEADPNLTRRKQGMILGVVIVTRLSR